MKQYPFLLQMIETVLHHQRIEDESAIDTTVDDCIGRQFRLPFFNHEAFALLTGHENLLLRSVTWKAPTYG